MNNNYFWTSLFIEELIRCGCTQFVVAPGSRSTPLAGAVAQNPKAHYVVTFDERSAGFFAVGYAKARKLPAAIIVTSGSAVANLMPAVVEASYARTPLIILSADRPWELRDVEANQTINQNNIFANFSRWFFELPCSDDRISPTMVLSTASHAVYRSRFLIAGPVQINCLFREPLVPVEQEYKKDFLSLKNWHSCSEAYTRYDNPIKEPSPQMLSLVADLVSQSKSGLLVVGSVKNNSAQSALLKLAQILNWPVCADIGSGLRQSQNSYIIKHEHHALLKPLAQGQEFDLVLQIGGRLISKTIEQLLSARAGLNHIMLDDHPMRSDPGLCVTHRVECDIEKFCESLIRMLKDRQLRSSALPGLLESSKHVSKIINNIIDEGEAVSEPYVARQISKFISAQSMLMASTSMPIRDYHMFAVYREDNGPDIVVNRGASGIDGLLSTAIGFAHASCKRSTVLIGDLAFMHDANALAMLSQLKEPMCIVVINNKGGGIFSFLPVREYPKIMTPLIDTPHDHDLSGFAQAFKIEFIRVKTKREFDSVYLNAQESDSHCVVEVSTDRQDNFMLHERIRIDALGEKKI